MISYDPWCDLYHPCFDDWVRGPGLMKCPASCCTGRAFDDLLFLMTGAPEWSVRLKKTTSKSPMGTLFHFMIWSSNPVSTSEGLDVEQTSLPLPLGISLGRRKKNNLLDCACLCTLQSVMEYSWIFRMGFCFNSSIHICPSSSILVKSWGRQYSDVCSFDWGIDPVSRKVQLIGPRLVVRG